MFTDAERHGTITTSTDSRITPIGRWLRRYKLDEFPQLWNVLIGKMSFVGPRPDVPGYADRLEGAARTILELRPGITGPASLYFRNEEDLLATSKDPREYNDTVIWPRKVELNLAYAENWSFWKDIGYILITVIPALNRGKKCHKLT
jgi:lipopolysaccharide/colanic/teichoic acid biosynthesis glycosyltransferase